MKKALSLCLALSVLLAVFAGCGQPGDTTTAPASTTAPAGTTASGGSTTAAPAQTTSASSEPKEITIGFAYDVTTLDVHNINDDGSYTVMRMLGEGLVRNDNGLITPGVAERWEVSADSMVYTFYLRKDAKWSDGSPLTAYDFEYTLRRVINPDNGLNNAQGALDSYKNAQKYYDGLCSIEDVGIKAVDEYTLVLENENPSLETLFRLADYGSFPVKQSMVEQHGVLYGSEADTIITNGPFTLVEWKHEDRLVAVKNENYWNKDAVKIDKITRRVGITADAALDMMQVGELDAWSFSDINQVETLTALGFEATPYVTGYQYVFLNSGGSTSEHDRFMRNTNFRRALNFAVNRVGITNSVYKGAEPANRITAPFVMGVNDLFNKEYPYEGWPAAGDAAKAKECLDLALAELGATIDDVPELSMLCYDSQRGITVLQAVQDMLLSTLGIKAKIDPQPIQQMLEKANNGDFDMFWGGKSLGTLDWLSAWAGDFDDRNPNDASNYHNEDYFALLDRARVTLSMQERKDLLFEMEKILCEDPANILIGWSQTWAVTNAKISGILTFNGDVNYVYADLAQ